VTCPLRNGSASGSERPEHKKWYAGETISLGIGQGYNNFTMLQMATAYATIASGGLRFKPRLVREIKDMVQHTTNAWPATRWSRCRSNPNTWT
jgi:cell division protein FtsI/penicillin-binding protein 2